jgi:cell division protein FtsB
VPFNEPGGSGFSTAQVVMKICLIVLIALGCLLIVLAGVGDRGILLVSTEVIPVVAIQWFVYLAVRAKQRAQHSWGHAYLIRRSELNK